MMHLRGTGAMDLLGKRWEVRPSFWKNQRWVGWFPRLGL